MTKEQAKNERGGSRLNDLLMERLTDEPNYVSDEGKVKKWVVAEEARNYSPTLLALLLKDAKLRETFFTEVAGATVFKMDAFLKFIEQKNFLSDSYTRYSQKIGLQIGGRFMNQRNEVELVFPYKDCILEGGQTKEDQKRNEIFFNQTLAQDEITQLLEPKVLTNAVRYTAKGKTKFEKISSSDNLIVKGNNLIALYSLKKRFRGKVKLIYIDPPYNTGEDGFGYNDAFNHSTWLTFMKNRLEVARDLLREDGAIFIHIDIHELSYLSVLADSIFGIDNRVQIISVKTATPAGFKTVNPGPIDVTEYILFYTKRKSSFNFKKGYVPVGYNVNYNLFLTNPNDNAEDWKFVPIKDALLEHMGYVSEKEAKAKYGTLWKTISKELIRQFAFENASRVVSVRDPHKPTAFVKEMMAKSRETGKVIPIIRENAETSYFYKGGAIAFYSNKFHEIDGELTVTELLTDFWSHISWAGIANEGGVKLKNGKKPEKLIKQIIELTTDKGDIVLDFFLGCGTTAAVAHKMGRQYIGVEQLDYGKNDSVARLCNVIEGDKTGVSKAVNWRGGGSFVYLELKRYNQKFIDEIEKAQTTDELTTIWEQMKARAFFRFNIEMQKLDDDMEGFKANTIDQQKQILCSLLDMNQLYVNRSDMDDAEAGVTEEEKRITKAFYGEEQV